MPIIAEPSQLAPLTTVNRVCIKSDVPNEESTLTPSTNTSMEKLQVVDSGGNSTMYYLTNTVGEIYFYATSVCTSRRRQYPFHKIVQSPFDSTLLYNVNDQLVASLNPSKELQTFRNSWDLCMPSSLFVAAIEHKVLASIYSRPAICVRNFRGDVVLKIDGPSRLAALLRNAYHRTIVFSIRLAEEGDQVGRIYKKSNLETCESLQLRNRKLCSPNVLYVHLDRLMDLYLKCAILAASIVLDGLYFK